MLRGYYISLLLVFHKFLESDVCLYWKWILMVMIVVQAPINEEHCDFPVFQVALHLSEA
jgi:hypothetical protein